MKHFVKKVNILVPDLNALYVVRRGRARNKVEDILVEHQYRVDIFNVIVNSQI